MFVVVAYDVQDDKRRNKVHKVLKNYGQWMQFSVFECQKLSKEQFLRLRHQLEKHIKPAEDSIRYYILCEGCAGKVIRIGGEELRREDVFLV
ncbi:MAG: CRISPR-associated endonuclease Cas2 [Bacillota bacterium]